MGKTTLSWTVFTLTRSGLEGSTWKIKFSFSFLLVEFYLMNLLKHCLT